MNFIYDLWTGWYSSNALDLCLDGIHFEFWPGHQLSWHFLWIVHSYLPTNHYLVTICDLFSPLIWQYTFSSVLMLLRYITGQCISSLCKETQCLCCLVFSFEQFQFFFSLCSGMKMVILCWSKAVSLHVWVPHWWRERIIRNYMMWESAVRKERSFVPTSVYLLQD
jgi:hypothetical protein